MQRKRIYALQDVVDGILWGLRVGNHGVARRWRNMPEGYPPWQSIYYYFRRWKLDQTPEKLNWAMNKLEQKRLKKEEK